MPHFRARVSDGKTETVIEEQFADEQQLRDSLSKRGWAILGVEQIAEPGAAASTPDEEAPPPPISPGQIREDGGWVVLPPAIAAQHPLYGIGGWAALLFALMALGFLLGVAGWIYVLVAAGFVPGFLWLYPLGLAFLAWQGFVTFLMLKEREAFPANFLALSCAGVVLSVVGVLMDKLSLGDAVSGIAALAWMAYVVRSRRINVTYKKRVARDDAWLRKGLEAGNAPTR